VAASLPAWWKQFAGLAKLESEFVQVSESAVFGTLRKRGRLTLAKGGRLRVAYDKGLLLVSDGKRMIQYDPGARTAQGLDLAKALAEFPILNLLVEPRSLERSFEVLAEGEGIRLKPRRPGLPEVLVEGKGVFPARISWKDGTGAQQNLTLVNPRQPAGLPETTFTFDPPKGTRWLGIR
jgi:outer membrane lipoprotein-sorting protein